MRRNCDIRQRFSTPGGRCAPKNWQRRESPVWRLHEYAVSGMGEPFVAGGPCPGPTGSSSIIYLMRTVFPGLNWGVWGGRARFAAGLSPPMAATGPPPKRGAAERRWSAPTPFPCHRRDDPTRRRAKTVWDALRAETKPAQPAEDVRTLPKCDLDTSSEDGFGPAGCPEARRPGLQGFCLLYTSDAADE